jgi:hypothetical protein
MHRSPNDGFHETIGGQFQHACRMHGLPPLVPLLVEIPPSESIAREVIDVEGGFSEESLSPPRYLFLGLEEEWRLYVDLFAWVADDGEL